MVMGYLLDYAKAMAYAHLDRFKANSLYQNGGEDQARGSIITLGEIATLELDHIKAFYQVPPEEDAP